jgi:large subunit ribosomal protein L22e
VIDYSKPAENQVFDGAAFEKYLHDRIKVEGKAGNLGDSIKIQREGE